MGHKSEFEAEEGGTRMKDIMSKDYANFLEETLQNITELPVEGICIMTKMKRLFILEEIRP